MSLASALLNKGDAFLKSKNFDSALIHFREAKLIFDKVKYPPGQAYSIGNIGMVYEGIGKNEAAEKNINEAIGILEQFQLFSPICDYLIYLADLHLKKNDHQGAVNFTKRSLQLAGQYGLKQQIANASLKLSELYETEGKIGEALSFYKMHISNRDSINNISSFQKMADLRTDYEVSQKQIELNKVNEQKRNQKILVFSLGTILFLALIILLILFRNNQNKQRAYKVLDLQKQETDLQKAKAEKALNELKLTQKQLIQSEKMASLGELTAGIAHELKNPLNFVNNFSEISVELLGELKEGPVTRLADSEKEEADGLIHDLEDNIKKILDHGKRADSIVKGMLQHARPSTGKREFVDINALTDEYLRLCYNGLNPKEKLIARFRTDFDESLTANDAGFKGIEVVPQEIGRVLLNLFSNAFYAFIQKKSQESADYEPLVTVSTKKAGHQLLLTVRDNGTGIPQHLVDKIFQPFFTTKPSGTGTGLGLSISHDIIKAHGGGLKVETGEGEFAEFTISLPLDIKNGTSA